MATAAAKLKALGTRLTTTGTKPRTDLVDEAPDGTHDVQWHAISADEALAHAASRPTGLSDEEIAQRRLKFGPNRMTGGTKRTLLGRVWDQINNALIWLLIVAAVIEAIFQSWADLVLIVAVIVINVAIGLVQEGKAEKAAEAIKKMLSTNAAVIRGGRKVTVAAEDVVPGDIVFLLSGDRVPADVRWLSVTNLQAQEGILTGESVPVEKGVAPVEAESQLGDRLCVGFSGTMVVYGSGTGVVFGTGDNAELGRINALVSSVDSQSTPLLDQLEHFGRVIAIITVLLAVVTFLISNIARNTPASAAFSEAVSVAVAIIPEGLPAVTTIVLALGVKNMAKQNAIIRQLPAVETLGSVSIICSDKTGTLTKNEMTVVAVRTAVAAYPVSGGGYDPTAGTICEPSSAPAGEGAAAATAPLTGALKDRLRGLLLPGVLANDASLVLAAPAAPAKAAPAAAAGPPPAPGVLGPVPNDAVGVSVRQPLGTTARASSSRVEEARDAAAPLAVEAPPAEQAAAAGVPTWQMTGDPTEGALLTLGMKSGVADLEEMVAAHPRMGTIPFESDYKFMAVASDVEVPSHASAAVGGDASSGGKARVVFVKGAYDIIISRCATQAVGDDPWTSGPIDRAKWLADASDYSRQGLRVLAFAQFVIPTTQSTITTHDVLGGEPRMQLNCLVAIVDPPRQESTEAIAVCKSAGIVVKMITGDHPDTARTIGGWVGIATDEVLTGHQLEAMPDEELEEHVLLCNIYARASPEHKLRIVRALQKHGHVVSMTGDGVNDAPALKQASVGVAMGITGTEVAKEAAKMILADDNFATIVKAVREGRGVYDNLRKILMFALPTNFAQGFCVLMALVIGMPVPLSPIQVLTINMVTSVTLGLVLALEKPEPDVMDRKPRDPKQPLLDAQLGWRTFYVTVLLVTAMLGNQWWTIVTGGSLEEGRTTAMTTLVVAQGFYAINCRYVSQSSLRPVAWYGNPYVAMMIVFNVALQCFLVYTPGMQDVWDLDFINGLVWLRILMFAVAIYVIVEIERWAGPRFIHPWTVPVFEWIRVRTPSPKGWIMRHLIPIPSSAHGAPASAAGSTRLIPLPQFEPLPAPELPGPDTHLVMTTAELSDTASRASARRLPIPAEEQPAAPKRVSTRRLAIDGAASDDARRSYRLLAVMDDVARDAGSRRVMDKDWAAPVSDDPLTGTGTAAPRQFEPLQVADAEPVPRHAVAGGLGLPYAAAALGPHASTSPIHAEVLAPEATTGPTSS